MFLVVGCTMPAWSLPGPILLTLAAPAGGDRDASQVRLPRIADVAPPEGREGPIATRLRLDPATEVVARHDRRSDRLAVAAPTVIRDPQADSVRALLRDRLARRAGAIDARVEWRLSGAGSDVGLGGGLARMVDTLLHD